MAAIVMRAECVWKSNGQTVWTIDDAQRRPGYGYHKPASLAPGSTTCLMQAITSTSILQALLLLLRPFHSSLQQAHDQPRPALLTHPLPLSPARSVAVPLPLSAVSGRHD